MAALVVAAALSAPGVAQGEFALDRDVRLINSIRNNTRLPLTLFPEGKQTITLGLRVNADGGAAELELSSFEAAGAPPLRVSLKKHDQTEGFGKPEERAASQVVPIELRKNTVERVDLCVEDLRPLTTYNATLFILHGNKKHEWEVTLKTTDFGALAVNKLPPLQLVTYAPFAGSKARRFQVVLRDPSGRGPYQHVRAHLAESGQVKNSAITSSVTFDAFSFWTGCWNKGSCQPVAWGELAAPRAGELTLWAQVESLSPGEYNPVIRFTADRASLQADDSKLALNLQIRHHWWLAVVVILLGSAAGLFGNKYVAGYWTTRALRRETEAAAQTAEELARPDPRGSPWWCRSGSDSYGLARARVILGQATLLSKSVFTVIAVESEIRERIDDAKRRLEALTAVQETRLDLLRIRIDQPAAQYQINVAIRHALTLVDGPMFGEAQKKVLATVLESVNLWRSAERQDALYLDAVRGRVRQLLRSVRPIDVPEGKMRGRVTELLVEIQKATFTDPAAPELKDYDDLAARLALLWRERLKGDAEKLALAEMGGTALEVLHRMADKTIWERLRAAALERRMRIVVSGGPVRTYDLVEARLEITGGMLETDVIDHPCRTHWTVRQPGGQSVEIVTNGLSLVHYSPVQGKATFEARLEWNDEQIPVDEKRHEGDGGASATASRMDRIKKDVSVQRNKEYRWWAVQSVEWAVTGLAALFAIATGLGSSYNATFGTSAQYVGLFLWAAGASVGGNLFKQRGGGRTVGGQDVPLPGR
jgi:hypothetical protein